MTTSLLKSANRQIPRIPYAISESIAHARAGRTPGAAYNIHSRMWKEISRRVHIYHHLQAYPAAAHADSSLPASRECIRANFPEKHQTPVLSTLSTDLSTENGGFHLSKRQNPRNRKSFRKFQVTYPQVMRVHYPVFCPHGETYKSGRTSNDSS